MEVDEVRAPTRRVRIISAGANHSVALLSGDIVFSWGGGEDGQLGHGDADDRASPKQLSALDEHQIVSVSCGAAHTIAYSESLLEVYSWGCGDFGRLGHGNSINLFTPLPIKELHGIPIKQIACGDSHCLAVTMEGEVHSWGRNHTGQLGLGNTKDSLVPQKIQAFQGIRIKMVAAGGEHNAAVTEDGDLYGWGWGGYGNLGLGDRNDRLVPERVTSVGGEKMSIVACGWRHTVSVASSSGAIYTCGWNKFGQLGHGDLEDLLVPHKLEALGNSVISQISGGWRHTMALTSDGELYGWGWNKFGQVGVTNNLDQSSPVQVRFPDDQKVVQVSCGWRHTLAVTERNNVFAWGRGTNGQLGIRESLDRNFPKILEALSVDGTSELDEISGLSDDLLVKILSYLPTKVAVSTSILSKRWEYLWMWLPKLKYYAGPSPSEHKSLRCFLDLNLPLHKAPVIDSFHLNIRSTYETENIKAEDVKLWLVIALSRHLRDLDITHSQLPKPNLLPSSLYTCKSLVTMSLSGTIPLDVPRMGCLPSLKTLQLFIDRYLDGVSLQRFLSICPVLVDLIVCCDGGNRDKGLFTVIVPSLQSLSVDITTEHYGHFDNFVIDTPTLKYLKLVNFCDLGQPCKIENMPNLVDANVQVRYSDIQSLIGSITSVKRLTICSWAAHSDAFVFNQLEHLKICLCVSENPLSLLVRFLEDSPNLRVLDINDHCEMLWDVPEVLDCYRSSLQAFNWSEHVERRPQGRDLEVYILGKRWSLKDCNNLA